MSTSRSSKAASCSAGWPGAMRGSGSAVASFHICVAMTRRLRSSIWSTARRLPPCGEALQYRQGVARLARGSAPGTDLEMEMIAPARTGAADRSYPLAHLHAVAGLEWRRAKHVEVHERVARLHAPDRDVVAAAAVVALLDNPAVANREERRAGRGEHVRPLVHMPTAVRAE